MRPLLGKLERTLKSARWKVAVAWVMKQHTSVSNGRLAEQLGMGSGVYVSKHVGLARAAGHPVEDLISKLKKVKGKTRPLWIDCPQGLM